MIGFDKFRAGLCYADFLARYASEGQKQRWQQVFDEVRLTAAQRELLAALQRQVNVL